VPQATLSEILQSGQTYFAQYLEYFYAVQISFEYLRVITFTVNKELNGLNATLIDSYSELLVQHANNDKNYLDRFSTLDEMINSGEGMVLEAINGMVFIVYEKFD
jgi:hypothetical protein